MQVVVDDLRRQRVNKLSETRSDRPTDLIVVDIAGDVKISIAVTDNATRVLSGSIVQVSTGKSVAALNVDRSGAGATACLGLPPHLVTSWLLSG